MMRTVDEELDFFRPLIHGEDLVPVIREFRTRVYDAGLRTIIDASRERGMSGRIGDVTIRSYVLAGRIMFTFERDAGDHQVSILGAEGDDNTGFGLQSIGTDIFTARGLIQAVIDGWPFPFADDANTTLDVLAGRGGTP